MGKTVDMPRLWWERDDLGYRNGRLFSGNQDLQALAQSSGTPVYAYNAFRIQQNLMRLSNALALKRVQFKIFYALKANRYLPLVTSLKLSGRCGVDVCSPGELLLARQAGFDEKEITYTGTSVSDEDIECLKRHPGVRINCDAISTLRRLGAQCPGRSVGIRINPQRGAGYHKGLHYAGSEVTKFGIYKDRFLEALDVAVSLNLTVKTLHFHIGSGYGTKDLNTLDEILNHCCWYLDQCPEIDTLDINEAIDILAEDIELPAVSEGDYLALLNTGGYGSAASSNHCMRGRFSEYLLIDEQLRDSGRRPNSGNY